MEIIISLLSGLLGALIASIIAIGYNEYKNNREKKLLLAREKLEKVYGPLVALKKKIDIRNQSPNGFLIASNPTEAELIEKILFNYYYLVDDDLKEGIVLLHQELTRNETNLVKQVQFKVEEKIFRHYNKNKKILGLR